MSTICSAGESDCFILVPFLQIYYGILRIIELLNFLLRTQGCVAEAV